MIRIMTPPANDEGPAPFAAIGRRIVQVRKALGYNQSDFARAVGVRQNSLSGWETGERRLGLDSALLMKERFEISLDYLYAGDHSSLHPRLVEAIRTGKKLR